MNRTVTTFDIMLIMLSFILISEVLPDVTTAGSVGATYLLWRASGIVGLWVLDRFNTPTTTGETP